MGTMTLNAEQERAVVHLKGPMLVLAGAGSGKTRIVTHRIVHLIEQGISPDAILAVTFTNKAASEMQVRVHALKNRHVWISTFHSLGAKILRESIHLLGYKNHFAIYDAADSEKLLKTCLKELNLSQERAVLNQMRSLISTVKNDFLAPSDIRDVPLGKQVYEAYQKKLLECNAVDFDDLLYLTVQLFQTFPDMLARYQNRWEYLLIDEYQDTNRAQYLLIRLLTGDRRNLFAVGDPDQSIYSWRGACYQNILNFERDFPGAIIITLEQNYRSTNLILQAANALIAHNESRYEKNLWSALGEGEKVGLYRGFDEWAEARFVLGEIQKSRFAHEQTAIFYRTNAQSRVFEDLFLRASLPYTIIGGLSFYERKEIKDLLAFFRMLISDTDLVSFLRTINIPKRGIGQLTLEKLLNAAADTRMPLISYLANPNISLGTKQRQGLSSYISLIQYLRDLIPSTSLTELLQEILKSTHYFAYLQQDLETFQERKENVGELIAKVAEWETEHSTPSIALFLEEISLNSSFVKDPTAPAVKLMSLHNSKGLEFDLVFLVGMEEDLLPHINSKDSPQQIEEERRLCYVGMTRAKKKLYLCHSTYRHVWGGARSMFASRFLKEIPPRYTERPSEK